MTQSETGIITANFNNPLEQTLEPYYQVEISNRGPFRKFENQISVAGHGVRSVQWTVDANDIDLGFFIMVKMTILPVGGYLTREATCGIIILNIPGLTGGQIFTLAFGVSLVGMIVGADLWENANEIQTSNSANQKRSMRAMAISALLAMLAGFLGWWGPGILLCAITILLFATFLQFLIRE